MWSIKDEKGKLNTFAVEILICSKSFQKAFDEFCKGINFYILFSITAPMQTTLLKSVFKGGSICLHFSFILKICV